MTPARILVVEDEEMVRRLAVTILSLEGYDVSAACDAETGRRMIAERKPDVVLMDRGLPGMDGTTLTRVLKTDVRTRSITILAFSSNAAREDDAEAVAAGCDGFIAKPFDVEALLRTVRWHALVRERRLGRPIHRQSTSEVAAVERPLGAVQCSPAQVPSANAR